jgi:hypothetical protein
MVEALTDKLRYANTNERPTNGDELINFILRRVAADPKHIAARLTAAQIEKRIKGRIRLVETGYDTSETDE